MRTTIQNDKGTVTATIPGGTISYDRETRTVTTCPELGGIIKVMPEGYTLRDFQMLIQK